MISFSVLHKMRPMMILNIYLLSLSTQDVYILSNFEHKPTVQLRSTSLKYQEGRYVHSKLANIIF